MRKFISAIVIIILLTARMKVNAAENNSVPADAIEFNNHSYKLFDTGCTQKQAIEICESLGGHLLTITSEDEQTFINSIIKHCTMKNIWLGGIYINNEWHWITDEDFVYLNWNHGEPNNVFNMQNAIMMYTYQETDNDNYSIEIGKWNDENENGRDWDGYTSEETGFICEWDFLKADNTLINKENSKNPKQDIVNDKDQSIHYEETYTDDDLRNGTINKDLENSSINITFHVSNLSLIGGISIFGGISFIGVMIKKKNKKNNENNDSVHPK